MTDEVRPDPEAEYELPVTQDTPEDVKSGEDEPGYNHVPVEEE